MWYLAPADEWSWEDEGLRIGTGQYVQGRLCLAPRNKGQNLAEAELVDLDDDGSVIQTYPNVRTLVELLLP
jgi:hypothetical protein